MKKDVRGHTRPNLQGVASHGFIVASAPAFATSLERLVVYKDALPAAELAILNVRERNAHDFVESHRLRM